MRGSDLGLLKAFECTDFLFCVLTIVFNYGQDSLLDAELRCADVWRAEVQAESTALDGQKGYGNSLGNAVYGAGCNSDRAA